MALVKEQCRLDMKKYSFSKRAINDWNKLSNNCVNASSVNMFKNKIDRYMIRAGYTEIKNWTFDKPMASLLTCRMELVVLDGNLGKYLISSDLRQ